jgi:2-iminobutanoate/2-iminopropanoate deaminase
MESRRDFTFIWPLRRFFVAGRSLYSGANTAKALHSHSYLLIFLSLPAHNSRILSIFVPINNTIKQNRIMKEAIITDKAPAAIGPYSQAIEVNGFVYASGQLPIDPATGAFPAGGIKEQTRQSLLNAQAILQAAGLDLKNVVKTTVLLSDIADFGPMNEVYAEMFSAPFPARSAFAVKDLPKGALVEIECIAAK